MWELLMAWTAATQEPEQRRVDELRKQMEQRLKELDERHERERERLKEEFDRLLKKEPPARRPESGATPERVVREVMDRLEKQLAGLEKRLKEVEKRLDPQGMGRVLRVDDLAKPFQFHLEKGGDGWKVLPEPALKLWQKREPELRKALEEFQKVIEEQKEELQGRLKEALDKLRKALDESRPPEK